MQLYDDHARREETPLPPSQPCRDSQHVLFDALRAQPGSWEDNANLGGCLSFLAQKFDDRTLFDICAFHLVTPLPTQFAKRAIIDCLKNVLLLCVQFPQGSDEGYIMRDFAQIFLPLLYVFGRSDSAVDKSTDSLSRRHSCYINQIMRKLVYEH